ncbi:MAG: carotenoid biosynthesis protein [Candidatus Methanodesulfokora washburnensis]|jgi:uncharacterized membrane protein
MRWTGISLALLTAGYAVNAILPAAGIRGPADLALLILFLLSMIFMLPFSAKIVLLPIIGSFIGFLFEYIGLSYGFPFGSYSYLKLEKYSIYRVPVPVIVAWGIYLYTCYLASTFLIRGKRRILIVPLLMVLLDMAVDPVMVEQGVWAWREKGLWFGVPLSNFLGWFTVSLTAICLYLALSRDDMLKTLSWHAYIPYIFSYVPILVSAGQNSFIPAFTSFLMAIALFLFRKFL